MESGHFNHEKTKKESVSTPVGETLNRQQQARRVRILKAIGIGALGIALLTGFAVGLHLHMEPTRPTFGGPIKPGSYQLI